MTGSNRQQPPRFSERVTVIETASSLSAQVLVVGRSQINLSVVSKIVERAGLRARSCTPVAAPAELARSGVSILIIDNSAAGDELAMLAGPLAERKGGAKPSLPFVVLLSTYAQPQFTLDDRGVVDATVAKPITPERLQPLLEDLRARLS